jgi:hypothetical protein
MWPVYSRAIDEYFASQLGRSTARMRRLLERIASAAGG